ncbi:hypothetical protein IMSAG013_01196 [Clostridiales bacterium]|nr:hypothetical protein IMSAG013_01196 [Clostridiales bacterium]
MKTIKDKQVLVAADFAGVALKKCCCCTFGEKRLDMHGYRREGS